MLDAVKNETQPNLQSIDIVDKGTYIDTFIDKFIVEYRNNHQSIEVDFRKLVAWVPYGDSYTHFIHSYPAKLLKHIPIFFINSKKMMASSDGVVLDPFCGSGTVLLEAIIAGYNAVGCDANPIARLISNVKTTPLKSSVLNAALVDLMHCAKRIKKYRSRNVINIDLWFAETVKKDLSRLHTAIHKIENQDVRNFFEVCFSNIVKKVSFADPNLSVPVKINPKKYTDPRLAKKALLEIENINRINVFDKFHKQACDNIKRMQKLVGLRDTGRAEIIGVDARNITAYIGDKSSRRAANSVDLIITSPPYSGAQKYIRASSLSLGWLKYCEVNSLRDYEKENIGREHYSKKEYEVKSFIGIDEIDKELEWIWGINPLRAHININYLIELRSSIKEMYRVLKKNSYCVIVIGNNMVCGRVFDTKKYVKTIAENEGFTTSFILRDEIHSRGLMTKRNKTANIINAESIMVFKK